MCTLSRGVGVGCLWVLMEWFEWMRRVVLSHRLLSQNPAARPGQAFYSQNRDGYEVHGVTVGRIEVGVSKGVTWV